MKATCLFGSHDGEEIKVQGSEAHFPFMDRQYTTEHRTWFETYGIAEIWSQLENIERWWPAPPRIPVEVYRWIKTAYGRVFLVFEEVRR